MDDNSVTSILRVTPNLPVAPIQPEIDTDDNQCDFVLWSSESSSESSDNEDNKMDIDEEASTKTAVDTRSGVTETLLGEKTTCEYEDNIQWRDIPTTNTSILLNANTNNAVTATIEQEPFFEFTGQPRTAYFEPQIRISPIDCYKLFLDDSIIENMVNETNKNASSHFIRSGYHKEFLSGWMDVNTDEMRSFIGLLIFMNCKRLPSMKSYWSADRDLSGPIAGHVMTETRFKRILYFWYFGVGKQGYFTKINNLLDTLNENFKKHKTPDRVIYSHMSTIYLRAKYKTEIPKKGQRFLRLIDRSGYTYKIVLVPPYNEATRFTVTRNALVDLINDYLDEGRLLIVHHGLLNLTEEVANDLLKRRTHIVAPIGRDNKKVLGAISKIKAKKYQVNEFQNNEGVTVFKWKNPLDDSLKGYGMSTYGTKLVAQAKISGVHESRLVIKQTPEYLTDFIGSIDVFEVANKYFAKSPLRYETTWYRRLAVDILTGPCVLNAYLVYKQTDAGKTCTYHKFQDYLWKQLFGFSWLVKDDTVSMEDTQ